MNPNKSHDERELYRSQTNHEQTESKSGRDNISHFVQNHDYTYEDFAERGKITQNERIRVVDESASGESEEFEDFTEMHISDWTVYWTTGARLSDGTILYEGRK